MTIGYEAAPRYARIIEYLTGQSEITPPGLALEVDRPEFKWLGGTYLQGGAFDVTSGAAAICEAMLWNPSRNLIGIVTRLRYSSTIGDVIHYRRLATLPGGVVQQASGPLDFRDARLIGTVTSTLQVWQNNPAVPDGGLVFDEVSINIAGSVIEDLQPIVIGPQTGVLLATSGVAIRTFRGGFRWYERSVRAEEIAVP